MSANTRMPGFDPRVARHAAIEARPAKCNDDSTDDVSNETAAVKSEDTDKQRTAQAEMDETGWQVVATAKSRNHGKESKKQRHLVQGHQPQPRTAHQIACKHNNAPASRLHDSKLQKNLVCEVQQSERCTLAKPHHLMLQCQLCDLKMCRNCWKSMYPQHGSRTGGLKDDRTRRAKAEIDLETRLEACSLA